MVPEMSPAGGQSSGDLAAKRDRTQGLTILGAAFLLALLGNWWVKSTVHQLPDAATASVPDKTGLLGFPEHFDPLSALERARDLSVRRWLFGVALAGVRPDGTLDMDHGGAARFVFGSRRGDGPQLPVPPGERRRQDHCGRQEVRIDAAGIHAEGDQPEHDCHGFGEWLPNPVCSLEQIWKFAIEKGASRSGLAEIQYFQSEAGPSWRFRLADSAPEYVLYGDCKRELHGKEAAGKIP
jgi:hypothetical protein